MITKKIGELFFGNSVFDEKEEYMKFCVRFLLVNMWCGFIFTGMFVVVEWLGINTIGPPNIQVMQTFTILSLLLVFLLRGHKERFRVIALIYAIACYFEYMSALLFVPQDEFRVIWFYTYFAGVYILLGQSAGIVATVITVPSIIIGNSFSSVPYSSNAMATIIISLLVTSVICYAYTSRSISFFRRMTEAIDLLRVQAAIDPLTGVMNARSYYAATDSLIQACLRTRAPFSVLFVDLDHFKLINDKFGHEAGDVVLKEAAACLAKNTRSGDALGRIGGEEFSMFLPNTDIAGAEVLAEKLRKSIEALRPSVGETIIKVTASIGVARNQPEHSSITDIQRLADQAMYLAKKEGRNRVTCFSKIVSNN
ncbi:GGDEF domain-containing protein [Azospirillaceae bacterium]